MDRRIRSAAVTTLACVCALALADASAAAPRAVPGELIVGFERGATRLERSQALGRLGLRQKSALSGIRAAVVAIPPGDVQGMIARLEADRRVRYAERNYIVSAADHAGAPNDPFFHNQWGLHNFGQTVNGTAGLADADIDAPEAWTFATGSGGVVVGVLDTGIDFGHPDLAGAMWVNPGEDCAGCRTDGADNDGNGYVDDWRGWDFVSNDNDATDDNGHGTHVAGIVGATGDNGRGIAGVSWNVRLLALKFLNANGSGTTADAIEALLYATAKGVPVTNNSWAGAPFSQAMLDALRAADAAGSLFVAAAGNDGADRDAVPDYPVAYDVPNLVTVAATDANDGRAWFSAYGRKSVDLGAPGVNVYSTWTAGSYRYASGTSMATPHVAGVAALAKAAFPSASHVGLKALLLRTVDPVASLAGRTATGGRLNAGSAVACATAPKAWLESPAPGFAVDVGRPVAVTVLAASCADPSGVVVGVEANGVPVPLTARGDGLYTGVFTPSEPGPLTLTASAAAGGAADSHAVTGTVFRAYAIEPGGEPLTLTLASGEDARVAFTGVPGQRVSLRLSGVTLGTSTCCGATVAVQRPDGTALAPASYFGTSGGFVDTRTLTLAGTYVVIVDPQGTASGGVTLTLYDVPPDATAPIAAGGDPVTTTTSVPGQNARLTFDGVAGQRVAVGVSGVTVGTSSCCSVKVSLLGPTGSTLAGPTYAGSTGGFIDTRTLAATGTHALVVDPQGAGVGSVTLRLYDVPPDVSGSLAPGGPSVTATTASPGQNARLTFAGSAGQRISLELTGATFGTSSCCGARVSILKPGGTLVSPAYFGTSGGFVDAKTLPESGTYTVVVDPEVAATGSVTLTLHDVPPDASASAAIGGGAVRLTMAVPGQNGKVTFAGSAGRAVSLRLFDVAVGTSSCCGSRVSVLTPSGTTLVSPSFVGTSGKTLTFTLPTTGTYSVVVDPQKAATGGLSLELG